MRKCNVKDSYDCDFENAIHPRRAVWLCPNCKRDISLEYIFWAQAAHPEWLNETTKTK